MTADGPLEGLQLSDGSRRWLGVPYSAPPVGALRFLPPQPLAAWTSPLDCTREDKASKCSQVRLRSGDPHACQELISCPDVCFVMDRSSLFSLLSLSSLLSC